MEKAQNRNANSILVRFESKEYLSKSPVIIPNINLENIIDGVSCKTLGNEANINCIINLEKVMASVYSVQKSNLPHNFFSKLGTILICYDLAMNRTYDLERMLLGSFFQENTNYDNGAYVLRLVLKGMETYFKNKSIDYSMRDPLYTFYFFILGLSYGFQELKEGKQPTFQYELDLVSLYTLNILKKGKRTEYLDFYKFSYNRLPDVAEKVRQFNNEKIDDIYQEVKRRETDKTLNLKYFGKKGNKSFLKEGIGITLTAFWAAYTNINGYNSSELVTKLQNEGKFDFTDKNYETMRRYSKKEQIELPQVNNDLKREIVKILDSPMD